MFDKNYWLISCSKRSDKFADVFFTGRIVSFASNIMFTKSLLNIDDDKGSFSQGLLSFESDAYRVDAVTVSSWGLWSIFKDVA